MHVTDSACEALSKLLGRAGPERCLRLSTVQGKYRFIVDEPIEQDILYRFDERVVLAVSDTVSRDLWGITVDCNLDTGRRKLIFRKAISGEPLDSIRDDADVVPPKWRAGEQIASLRGGSKSMTREKLHTLEAEKQGKWDAIRALWAGDGGWHKLNGTSAAVGATAPAQTLAD